MNSRNEQLLQRLLAMFTVEAEEHVGSVTKTLLELDRGVEPGRLKELIEKTFREIHTLKGAARTVNLAGLVALCHALESLLALMKQGTVALDRAVLDLMHASLKAIAAMVPGGGNGPNPPAPANLDSLIGQLNRLTGEAPPGPPPPMLSPPAPPAAAPSMPSASPPSGSTAAGDATIPEVTTAQVPATPLRSSGRQTIRVPIAQLDFLLHQAEELITAKLSGASRVGDLRSLGRDLTERSRVRSRLTREAQVDHDSETLAWLGTKLSSLAQAAENDARGLAKSVDGLLTGAKQVLMLPATNLLDPVAQNVRELSREQGKDIQLDISGQELELDRRVQEELRDALLHLIRNGIDHGIETAEERQAKGKPAQGKLSIAVSQRDGGKAEIAIADDGRGMDGRKLVAEAVASGLLDEEEAKSLTAGQIMSLAFQSGLSTSDGVTDLSGRGLGLAIVQEKVERLGGSITVESVLGAGTTFRLLLPVTMAALRVVIVAAAGRQFAIPTNRVERVARVPARAVELVEEREIVRVDGKPLAMVGLTDLLRVPLPSPPPTDFRNYLVLAGAGHRIAVEVEQVVGENEVLMKGLGWPLTRVSCIAGAMMLPSGGQGFVLNVHDLLRNALRPDFKSRPARSLTSMAAPARKSILIAEDSITARTLFKHVLEAAGYRVRTAVDGMEAWGILTGETFDLVVSDVEMPRMSGFELTAKIRQDSRLGETPVVLITSLESREDREHGVDVGASAYIVKKSFDQSDLLNMIGRLI